MTQRSRYLRFEGRLWENMAFERIAGWETVRAARLPEDGNPLFVVELHDERGVPIVRVSPVVDFGGEPVCPSGDEIRSTPIVTYIPIHPAGRELVFRRGEFVLYREAVAKQPPSIQIEEVSSTSGDRLAICWSATHSEGRPLTYNLVYVAAPDRVFPIARGLIDNACEVELGRFPGSGEARVAVLATDGVRSAFAVSEPLAVAEKPPRVWIQTPEADAALPADQPVSLCGQALDIAGASLPDAGLVWRVNGNVVARGVRLVLVESLEPGDHQVTLQYMDGASAVAEQTIRVQIAGRSREQQRFRELMSGRDWDELNDFSNG